VQLEGNGGMFKVSWMRGESKLTEGDGRRPYHRVKVKEKIVPTTGGLSIT